MQKCSFCKSFTDSEKTPDGWGRAKLSIPGSANVDLTFCPLHKLAAERELDLAFERVNRQ